MCAILQIFVAIAMYHTGIAKKIFEKFLEEPFLDDAERVCGYLDEFVNNCCAASNGDVPVSDIDEESVKEKAFDDCLDEGLRITYRSKIPRVLIIVAPIASSAALFLLMCFVNDKDD